MIGLLVCAFLFAMAEMIIAEVTEPVVSVKEVPGDPAMAGGALAGQGATEGDAAGPPHVRPEPLVSPFFTTVGANLRVGDKYTSGGKCKPFHCQKIPMAKHADEYRIACFGGSTTYGFGLDASDPRKVGNMAREARKQKEPFCALVRDEMARKLPHRRVTAYNLGGIAKTTGHALSIMSEAARKTRFDLWIVYAGHNEFFGKGDLVHELQLNSLQKASAYLKRKSALYRQLDRFARRLKEAGRTGVVREYTGSFFKAAHDHEEQYDAIVENYRAVLNGMVQLARREGIVLVFSEPVSNLTWWQEGRDGWSREDSCFGAEMELDEIRELRAEHDVARELMHAGHYKEAMAGFRRVLELDPGYSLAATGVGHCLAGLSRRREALEQLRRARALDRYPIIAPPIIKEVLAREAKKLSIALAANRPTFDRIYEKEPGRYQRLFLDDCHLSVAGHHLIMKNIMAALDGEQINKERSPIP